MDDRRGHPFRRGKHHRTCIRGPRHLPGPVGPASPDVGDRFAVDVDSQRPAAEPATGKEPGEDADDVRESRIGGPCTPRGRPSSARRSDDVVIEPTMRPLVRTWVEIRIFSQRTGNSRALVDRVENLHRALERDGGDPDVGTERVVETVDDKQQQPEQDSDGAG